VAEGTRRYGWLNRKTLPDCLLRSISLVWRWAGAQCCGLHRNL